jgi:hypothetical protein
LDSTDTSSVKLILTKNDYSNELFFTLLKLVVDSVKICMLEIDEISFKILIQIVNLLPKLHSLKINVFIIER